MTWSVFKKSGGKDGGDLSWRTLVQCSRKEARDLLPYELALRLRVLPLGVIQTGTKKILTLACDHTGSAALLQELRFATQHQARLIVVDSELLQRAIFSSYHQDEDRLQTIVADLKDQSIGVHLYRTETPLIDDNSSQASRFVSVITKLAISKNASDLHLIPQQRGVELKLRIDGEFLAHHSTVCELTHYSAIVNRFKILSGLDTTKRNLPQDGSLSLNIADREEQVRISFMPTIYGEKIVLRFLGGGSALTIEKLNLPATLNYFIDQLLQEEEGCCLFTGPTGGGKSTSMYAVLKELHQRNLSVVTVEDPVEIRIEGIAQTEVDHNLGLNYPTALRALLRQDPDVILIGEIRDSESANIALQASLTGHLILSTTHGGSIAEALTRLQQLGVDRFQTLQALRLIICQKLLPRLCQHCRVVDLEGVRTLFADDNTAVVYKQGGCIQCSHSGYLGRVPVAEALYLNSELRHEMVRCEDINTFLARLKDDKRYLTWRESALPLLKEGVITLSQFQLIQ